MSTAVEILVVASAIALCTAALTVTFERACERTEESVMLIVVLAAVAFEIEVAKLANTALDVAVTCPVAASLEARETTVAI